MRTVLIVTLLALTVVSSPALASLDVVGSNASFLLDWLGRDAREVVTLPDGRVVELAEAVQVAAARLGDHPLAKFLGRAADAVAPDGAGDVWVLERGQGTCGTAAVIAQPISVAVDPRMALHAGYVGEFATFHGDSTSIFSWSTGRSFTSENTGGFHASGSIDPFCVTMGGSHFALPFLNGVVWLK